MKQNMSDRIISVLSYCTFGMFSIVWLIFANLTRRNISSFLSFNIYQAIFISFLLAIVSLLYGIAINLISIIPLIGKLAVAFDVFFNQTPLYFSFTVSGFLTTLLVLYLSILSFAGKRPQIPLVSDIICANFGG